MAKSNKTKNKDKALFTFIRQFITLILFGSFFILMGLNVFEPTIDNPRTTIGYLVDTESDINYSELEGYKFGIYRFSIDGEEYTIKDRQSYKLPKKYKAVIYNSEDPSDSLVKIDSIHSIPFILFGVFLITIAIVCPIHYKITNKEK